MSTELTGHIMQIQGEPAGGIRRHVHSIILGLQGAPGLKQSYACAAAAGDAGFKRDLPALMGALEGRLLDLEIGKRPAPADILNLIKLARYIRERGVTIVHGHGAKGGAYARLLGGLCGVKAVYTPHGGAVHKMFGWTEDKLYAAAEKFFFGFTDYFIFESSYTAGAYFAKVGKEPRNWTVNHNGIPPPDLAAVQLRALALGYRPASGGALNVGVFGILRPQKGQLYAIRAAAELAARNVRIKLHLYGKGPDKAALEGEASRLGLAGDVLFHGEVAVPEPHMAAMDVILIPSLFEAFGYVAIEAFSLRKPVVAAAAGGLKEIIRDGTDGLLVSPGDPLAMAGALERLSADAGLRRELAGKGQERFSLEFTEARMIGRVSEIYARLAAEARR
ncbi:MAG: glycosyltransferase family 4 protein [Elusimicrobiota bacterium]